MNCNKFSTTCWYYGFNKNENHEDQHRQPKETAREISDQLRSEERRVGKECSS